MAFNENTRVKVPAILHLCQLGYQYLPLKNAKRDENTNIFTDIFADSLRRINKEKEIDQADIDKAFETLSLSLDNDDLGQAFYQRITDTSGIKIIDFSCFENNVFHVATELTYKRKIINYRHRSGTNRVPRGMPTPFVVIGIAGMCFI